MVDLDTLNEACDNRRLTGSEGEVGIDMERSDGCEISLDRLGLNSATIAGDPAHDGMLGGGEDGAVGVVEVMELNVLNELALASGVCPAGAGSEPMP
jgi:hypothetical protein